MRNFFSRKASQPTGRHTFTYLYTQAMREVWAEEDYYDALMADVPEWCGADDDDAPEPWTI